MKRIVRYLFFLLCCSSCLQAQEIALAGNWRFAIDRSDAGIRENWQNRILKDNIKLPGTMITNNKGDEVGPDTKWTASIYDSSFFYQPRFAAYRQPGNYKFPCWLIPQKYYVGAAWYQKEVTIPANWKGKPVRLYMERVHIGSSVWFDGKRIDSFQNSLSAPHVYELTASATPGKHTITVRIDNRMKVAEVGQDSHSVTDHTQGNWNGIIGKICLQQVPALQLTGLQIYPVPAERMVKVKYTIRNTSQKDQYSGIIVRIPGTSGKIFYAGMKLPTLFPGNDFAGELEVKLEDSLRLWNEFDPYQYRLIVEIGQQPKKEFRFGMRTITVKNKSILLNGQKIFLRGDLNNCEFPLTGHPPMDVNSWRSLFTTLKNYGLNHVRFHSWCPPDAAFTAADELGFYLQPEAPTWPNHGTSLGDGRFIDQYIYAETSRMVNAYGNHPSFVMLAAGNEPAGRNQAKYLAGFIDYWKKKDDRRIYTGASVATSWPLVPENEYMVKSGARGLDWSNKPPTSMDDYNETMLKYPVPFVQHEQGQWCVFPDFNEIALYTGAYKARNFELFRADMQAQGLLHLAPDFLNASGKLQALCYKMEMERSLRTKDLAGFQLLGLQDFPGQGTALVGVLNAFYKEKGYSNAAQFRQFCNSVVPLVRLPRFTYRSSEQVTGMLELYQYGSVDLNNTILDFKLTDQQGNTVRSGSTGPENFNRGDLYEAGAFSLSLKDIPGPQELQLVVTVRGTAFTNQWPLWVFPDQLPPADYAERTDLLITDTLDAKAIQLLDQGGKVFLNLYGKVSKGREVIQAFTPVFWNTSWFKMRPPHTLGLLIDTTSNAFAHFPTRSHSDLQWWEPVVRSQVMHLEDFPVTVSVPLRPIDTWFMNRRLAMIFEGRVGKGRLLVSSIDFSNKEKSTVMRQLYYSLLDHLLYTKNWTTIEVEPARVRELTGKPSRFVFDAFTSDSPDELKPIKSNKQ